MSSRLRHSSVDAPTLAALVPYRATLNWMATLACLFCSSLVGLVLFTSPSVIHAQGMKSPQLASPRAFRVSSYGQLPLAFEPNQGQTDSRVRFLSRGQGYTLFLTAKEAVLALHQTKTHTRDKRAHHSSSEAIRMQFLGAKPTPLIEGQDMLPGAANYLVGRDPEHWNRSIPTYARVSYHGVYPGIDLVFYGAQQRFEYDFVVAPHMSPKPIQLHFAGARKMTLLPNGDLLIDSGHGAITFRRPFAYQDSAGTRKRVNAEFSLLARATVGFSVARYDTAKALIIDPTLSYSSYVGGTGNSSGQAIAVDASGNAYVTGYTDDVSYPTTAGSYQTSLGAGATNILLTKINSSGTALVYSTFIGGMTSGDDDEAFGVAVDSFGNAYLCGKTTSADFPVTRGAFQTINPTAPLGTASPFVVKLNPAGSALLYSTFLAGSGDGGEFDDAASHVAVDSSGAAYVTGVTYSADFPLKAPYQSTNRAIASGGSNAFVSKLDPSGASLIYSTYLGGSGMPQGSEDSQMLGDGASGIAIDGAGNAFITGAAASPDFPVSPGAYQSTNHGAALLASNAFVTKINSTGSALLYSTYLGGSGKHVAGAGYYGDEALGIALDASDDAYITGYAFSHDFPVTASAFQTTNKAASPLAANAFVAKLSPDGTSTLYSGYLGGSGGFTQSTTSAVPPFGEFGNGIVVDASGDAYVAGSTSSSDFPTTTNVFQATNKASSVTRVSTNAFISEVDPQGQKLLYSTYFGGSAADTASGPALGPNGGLYLTGVATSLDFPTTIDAYQTAKGTANRVTFVAKFQFGSGSVLAPSATALTADANPQVVGGTVNFTATVQAQSGGGVPTGSVSFLTDGASASTVSLDPSGRAVFTTSTLASGMHTVVAQYSGDTTYAASSSSVTETIEAAGVTPAATPTFSPAGGAYTSTRTVMIGDGTAGASIYYTTDGSVPTTSSTKYTDAISVTTSVTIKAIATAAGYSTSAIGQATYTISTPGSFTLAISSPGAAVIAGQSASTTLALTPQNGFQGAVMLSCSGLASGDACAFNPAVATLSGTHAVQDTLTITTSKTTPVQMGHLIPWSGITGAIAALLIWPLRRRPGRCAWMLIAWATCVAISGCGGGSKTSVSTVVITATGGGVTQTASFQLTEK